MFNKTAVTLNSAIKNRAGLGAKGACHSEMTQMPVEKDPKRFNVGRSCSYKCLLSSCVLLYVVPVAVLQISLFTGDQWTRIRHFS